MADTGPSASAAAKAAAPLDELMLAMDVVDTLRHREHLVARELGEGARKGSLIGRLKEIYADQGIDVPEHILNEGVEALKRDRFVYTPPPASFSISLARIYVTRARWGKALAMGVAAILVGWLAYSAIVVWPGERRAEAQRIELEETLPADMTRFRDLIFAETDLDEVKAEAQALYESGIAAAKAADRPTAAMATDALLTLRVTLAQEYDLRIVSRQGEQSGVWRIPDANTRARNYYLIVEAIGENGTPLTQRIRNEENGKIFSVDKWGVRVSKVVFDRIRKDKSDDGIIQNNIVATKARGKLEPDTRLPTLGGAITDW